MTDWVADIETYPNCFLLGLKPVGVPVRLCYEISPWRNDSQEIIGMLHWLARSGARLVTFNGVGFDYPVLHTLLRAGQGSAEMLYAKAMSIIDSQDDDQRKWSHRIKPTDYVMPILDLFLIHHFDNMARSTSLKVLEFNMRSRSIQDLPFPVGTVLTQPQIEVLKNYNAHDIDQTERFYFESLKMIAFREELTRKLGRSFLNHNDTKIGKDYFIMSLEAAGVACYQYSNEDGRSPRQTRRPVIALRDAILPWIEFQTPEFQRVVEWLRGQSITETKGVFKDLSATVAGFTFDFGTGGIHGSVTNRVIEADNDHAIIDLDVSSYYPHLAMVNGFYPEHLGPKFCEIYRDLYQQRKQYAKGSAENAMLKLALNGVYGDSNNHFSVFYDPLFTMRITLNGQLLICVLAEMLLTVRGLEIIQCNTDGITVRVPVAGDNEVRRLTENWSQATQLPLEHCYYRRMFIRDVNNYLAERVDGVVKRKGAYEYELEWHQNHSALVVPKVAEQHLLTGCSIREAVENWPDLFDFLLRVKLPRAHKLTIEWNGTTYQLQNTTRYAITKEGGRLYKIMPPLKGSDLWRKTAINASWNVSVLNDIEMEIDGDQLGLDYNWYVTEVEKLCNGLA